VESAGVADSAMMVAYRHVRLVPAAGADHMSFLTS
jgi:hypothetical protein